MMQPSRQILAIEPKFEVPVIFRGSFTEEHEPLRVGDDLRKIQCVFQVFQDSFGVTVKCKIRSVQVF